ncbi:hypothetical protein DE146DRAFT_302984 [Phaeosphaeria sp. MPI-PUGE-AT-0046c]|nr:hypothetical protein DE146DRAFT_302984 [Phaeosphaeria sp. MPI-PUGE-AT-0046c]
MSSSMGNQGSHGHHLHHGGSKGVAQVVNEEVSQLAPYAGIILTVILVIYFFVRYYIFEKYLLKRIHGDVFEKLNDNQRRGFINHHIAAIAKIIMLGSAAYPFFSILAGKASVHTPVGKSKIVTYGDILLVDNQIFVAMYLFELIFRAQLSPVAVAHHVGSVIIAAAAVAISLDWEHHTDATLEFLLCLLWGAFDCIAEFWPHVAIILYRRRPNDHVFMAKVFFSAMVVTFTGTIVETIVVFYFWGSAWQRWTLAFKIVTPILHCIFCAAQLWGAYNFYTMWQGQKKKMKLKAPGDEEAVTQLEVVSGKEGSGK